MCKMTRQFSYCTKHNQNTFEIAQIHTTLLFFALCGLGLINNFYKSDICSKKQTHKRRSWTENRNDAKDATSWARSVSKMSLDTLLEAARYIELQELKEQQNRRLETVVTSAPHVVEHSGRIPTITKQAAVTELASTLRNNSISHAVTSPTAAVLPHFSIKQGTVHLMPCTKILLVELVTLLANILDDCKTVGVEDVQLLNT